MRIELSFLLPYDWPQVRDSLAEDALALHVRGPARGPTATVRRVFDLWE